MTIIRTLAAALAIAALAVPAAQAAPIDLNAPVTEAPAAPSEDGPKDYSKNSATGDYIPPSPAYPTPAAKSDDAATAAAARMRDLRMPDTYDAAHGRGTFNAPDVTVVRVPSPAPASSPSSGGVDWEDVGIGAGGMLAMIAVAGIGTAAALHRRPRTPAAV
ncbi:MAG TPA: hypothetical protein VHJ39_08635 [Solirubrobacteraceae bacterium]|jgi:hypothetical protein|nr:hypothetical protein [Solirubrobacteraceae bacterium]